MNKFRTKSYFKALYGCKKQSPQFLIKEIKVDSIGEMAVGLKCMSSLVLFHWAEIVSQTEITHDL